MSQPREPSSIGHGTRADQAEEPTGRWTDGLVALARTVVEATFVPLRFLARWRAEPARYLSPGRLIAVYATLAGLSIYLAGQLGLTPTIEDDTTFTRAREAGRFAGALFDGGRP